MEYVEATDSQEDKAVEALPQEEREKWYRDFWKAAQAEKQKPLSPQEADERFTARIETNEGLDDFLSEINEVLTFAVEDAPQDPEEQAYCIARLMIDAAYQGVGDGCGTLHLLMAEIRAQRPARPVVYLSVLPDNAAAIALYTRFGFVPDGRTVDGETVYRFQL